MTPYFENQLATVSGTLGTSHHSSLIMLSQPCTPSCSTFACHNPTRRRRRCYHPPPTILPCPPYIVDPGGQLGPLTSSFWSNKRHPTANRHPPSHARSIRGLPPAGLPPSSTSVSSRKPSMAGMSPWPALLVHSGSCVAGPTTLTTLNYIYKAK
jgi:hypothetical protein